MSADRPINADVGAPKDEPEPPAAPSEAPAESTRKTEPKRPDTAPGPGAPGPREEPIAPTSAEEPVAPARSGPRRRRIPGPIKLVATLVVVAIGFIALAVFLGGGSGKDDGSAAPTTPTVAQTTPAPTTGEPGEAESAEGSGDEASTSDEASEASGEGAEELGYPSFATSNTTRIGGSDPISNAAAAALAVFPSMSGKQQPVAVALVGAEDWPGALAAAVLMAEPIRAPLLYGEADGIPDATAASLSQLQPGGGAASGGHAVLAIGEVQVPDGMSAAKIASGDAASEAAAIASLRDRLAGAPPKAILLASSSEPGYAAPAAAYAARSGDPILFAEGDNLPKPTAEALRDDKGVPVYALGPGSAVSGKVLKEVEALGSKVHRISGENPVATAIAFARFGEGKFGWKIADPGHGFVLTRSDAPLEAAAAAPLSASGTWGPLLVTDSADSLPSELRGYFLDVKPGYTTNPTRAFYNHVWIIGDAGQISVEQQAEVNEVAELAKIGGSE